MSTITASTNYVKFIRGTPAAFSNLLTKDPNTLYFVCATASDTGSLYLGSKLIGGASTLADLTDIITKSVGDKQVLAYDSASQKWINTSVASLVGPMQGATLSSDGVSGLVPAPKAGDQKKFLRGDGTWVAVSGSLNVESIDDKVLTTTSGGQLTLQGFGDATTGTIAQKDEEGKLVWVSPSNLNSDLSQTVTDLQTVVNGLTGGLRRTIKQNVTDIDTAATDAEYYIYMVPNGSESDSGNVYNEYMVVEGKLEKVGNNLSGDITGYVTEEKFTTSINNISKKLNNYVLLTKYNTEVGDLTKLTKTQTDGDTLVDQVNDLTDRLTWYLLTE